MDKQLIDSLMAKKPDEIPASVACSILNVGRSTFKRLCGEYRVFKTARKKTMGKTSPWVVSRAEVIQFKINTHAQPFI
jgi:hypothetical protein